MKLLSHKASMRLALLALVLAAIGCAPRKSSNDGSGGTPPSTPPATADQTHEPEGGELPMPDGSTPTTVPPTTTNPNAPKITAISGYNSSFVVTIENLEQQNLGFYLKYYKNATLAYEGYVPPSQVYPRGGKKYDVKLGLVPEMQGKCPTMGEPICVNFIFNNPPSDGTKYIQMARATNGTLTNCK